METDTTQNGFESSFEGEEELPVDARFRRRNNLPLSMQLVDAEQRIQELELRLRQANREVSRWNHAAEEERLRLRVSLQEQKEMMDMERYRLETLAQVAQLSWGRMSKRRALLRELSEDLRSTG